MSRTTCSHSYAYTHAHIYGTRVQEWDELRVAFRDDGVTFRHTKNGLVRSLIDSGTDVCVCVCVLGRGDDRGACFCDGVGLATGLADVRFFALVNTPTHA